MLDKIVRAFEVNDRVYIETTDGTIQFGILDISTDSKTRLLSLLPLMEGSEVDDFFHCEQSKIFRLGFINHNLQIRKFFELEYNELMP